MTRERIAEIRAVWDAEDSLGFDLHQGVYELLDALEEANAEIERLKKPIDPWDIDSRDVVTE